MKAEAGRLLCFALRMLAIVMAATSLATAQEKPYPIFTPEQFVAAMKTIGLNFGAVNQSLGKHDYDTAKAQFIRVRESLATTITFWRDRQKQDGLRMVRSGVKTLDQVDAALSLDNVDPTEVKKLVEQLGTTCQTCHAAYRDQDPATNAYRFKSGILP
jgi:cytochrome c556